MPNFTLFERKPLIWLALVVPVCLRDRGNAEQVEGAVLCAGRGGEDGDEAIALDNAMRRQFAPIAAIIMRSGYEDIRPGDRLE